MFEGLKYMLQLGKRKMELNVDLIAVVEVILKGVSTSYERHALIQLSTRLIEMHENVKVRQHFEKPTSVDALANEGCKLHDNFIYFSVVPDFLRVCLKGNSLGVLFHRLFLV